MTPAAPPEKSGRAPVKDAPDSFSTPLFNDSAPVNGTLAGFGWESGQRVAVEWPEMFRPREEFSDRDLRSLEIGRAAVRYLLGMETRPMAVVAREVGTSRAGISAAFTRLSRRLGFGKFLKSAACREHLADATRRAWAKRRGAP